MGNNSGRRRIKAALSGNVTKIAVAAAAIVVSAGLVSITVVQAGERQNPTSAYTPRPFVSASPSVSCDPGDPNLARAAAAYKSAPSDFHVAVLGDSTRDESAAGVALMTSLRQEFAGADVRSFGRNGFPLSRYADETGIRDAVREYQPDVIELSIGINDFRQGRGDVDTFTDEMVDYVNTLSQENPDADIILSVPAALSTVNVGDANYLTGSNGRVNPDGLAQDITQQLRAAYTTASQRLEGIALLDVQQAITGTDADASPSPVFLRDQIHPNDKTAASVAALIADRVGDSCA